MCSTFLTILLLNIATVLSSYKNLFNNPKCIENNQAIVEYYKIDDYQYIFFSERVPWNEAKTICPIYEAELAIVDSAVKAFKLAAAIAESNIDIEDIWIGGQKTEEGNWTWINDEPLSGNSSEGFPPWIRSTDSPWKNCLAMDRRMIDLPLFIDLECLLPKPFMCQRDVDELTNPDITLPSNMVTHGKSTYIFYHTKVPWAAAVAFCRMRSYRLAVIPNNEVARLVSTAMLRSRPIFENVWLSGHFLQDKWQWLPTGQNIDNSKDANYPPWHHNSTSKRSGCILFDRHICAEPVFLATSCDRRRDFVCEKNGAIIKNLAQDGAIKIKYKSSELVLYLKNLPWDEAQKHCNNHASYLAEVYNYQMMKTITTAMSDHALEPTHVWLGGRFINNTWVWTRTNEIIPKNIDETGFVPWCDIEDKESTDCLNMDRTEHDKPAVYGLRCDMNQPFVCTKATKIRGKVIFEQRKYFAGVKINVVIMSYRFDSVRLYKAS